MKRTFEIEYSDYKSLLEAVFQVLYECAMYREAGYLRYEFSNNKSKHVFKLISKYMTIKSPSPMARFLNNIFHREQKIKVIVIEVGGNNGNVYGK